MRSFVSFVADMPSASTPPGREVAVVLSEILTGAGQVHAGPEDRKGRGWALTAAQETGSTDCVVQRAEQDSDRWLVEISTRRSGFKKFAPKEPPEHFEIRKAWAVALHDGLEADPRVDDVRWAGVGQDWWP